MTNISFETAIIADGTYVFPPLQPGRGYVVEIAGNFGTGAITLGYISPDGSFITYKDGIGGSDITSVVQESWEITTPSSGKLVVVVTGSVTPTLKLFTTLKQ